MDLIGILAAGMRQLQDAQARALERKSGTEDPETVKPGVSALPLLKGARSRNVSGGGAGLVAVVASTHGRSLRLES